MPETLPAEKADCGIVVLHVIKDLGLGGTQHLLAKHVRQLAKDYPDWRSLVVVLGRESDAYAEYIERLPPGVRFLGFDGRYRNPVASVRCVLALRRCIKELNPSIVHSYLWNSDVFAQLARMGTRVPQLAHVVDRRMDRNASRLPARWKARFTGWLHRRGGTAMVAVSEACRTHVLEHLQICPERVLTAHNGIPTGEFEVPGRLPPVRGAVIAGTISNFKAEKGHSYLIEAMRLILDAGVPMHLKIAGDGRARHEMESLAESLGVRSRIDFIGRVPSAAEFYSQIDLFVIPSIYAEGLPTTILEAMAASLPVVSTDVGGAVEAVRDGREGLLVRPRDARALADALIALANDPDCLRAMGEAGYRRVKDGFTIEAMTRTIVENAYRPLLGDGEGLGGGFVARRRDLSI